jgi:hypothetical protein
VLQFILIPETLSMTRFQILCLVLSGTSRSSHSGSVLGSNFRALPPDINHLAGELAAAESGLIVFASSTGRELSKQAPGISTHPLSRPLRRSSILQHHHCS